MNKFYFIIPAVMLVGFIFVYNSAVADMKVREEAAAAKVAADKKAADDHRHELEVQAAKDAQKRQEQAAAEEKAKQEKKDKDYRDAMDKLKKETDDFNAEGDKFAKEAAEYELKLNEARTLREKTNRDTFEIAREVEAAKINRRKAELEIQRMIEIVGDKAGAMASMPVAAPAPAR